MNSKIFEYIVLTISTSLFNSFYFCTSFAQTIENVDGVRIVHNEKPIWGNEAQVELKFVRQIGEFNSLDDNYLFSYIMDIEKDAEGNIYIVDNKNYRIQKYDPKGIYLKTFGSGERGEGPAEFRYVQSVSFDSEGLLYIADRYIRKILVLDRAGKEIKRFSVKNNGIGQFLINSSDYILIQAFGNTTPEERTALSRENKFTREERRMQDYTPHLIRVFDTGGSLLKEFGQKKDFVDLEMTLEANHFYFALDEEDNIYVSFQRQNRIEKYSKEGKLLLKIDRKTDFKETTENVLEKGPPGGLPSTKYNYFSFGIGFDYKERIWVLGVKKQRQVWGENYGMHIEIYDRTGILLGILPLPRNIFIPEIRVFGNQVYIIDNRDELAVFIYEIVEK